MANTFTFDFKSGHLSAVSMIRASREHTCECGAKFTFTLDWPEGLTSQGGLNIKGASCPVCKVPLELPRARYWVEDFQLRSAPLPEEGQS